MKKIEKLTEVKHNDFILKFTSTTCVPCKRLDPILEGIESETNIPVYVVDVYDSPEITDQYNIQSVPTTIYFKDGFMDDVFVGLKTKDEIMKILED